MTRIVVDPVTMTAAARRLDLVADDLAALAGALRPSDLPAMPPGMAAHYEGAIAAVAQRAGALGEPLAEIGAELRRRAAVAQVVADDRGAGTTLTAALGGTAGASVARPIAITGGTLAPAPAAPVPADATANPADPRRAREAARAVHAAATTRAPGDAELRAAVHDGSGAPAPAPLPGHGASEQDWACWMAGHAAHQGLPPALPIALALARSGLRNLDAGDGGVGFFGIPGARDLAPAGFGLRTTDQPGGDWWLANPDAQLAHVLRDLSAAAPGDVPADAQSLGAWAAQAEPGTDPDAVAQSLAVARSMVMRCRHGDGAAAAHGHAGFLRIAESQLGVHETAGSNSGPEVDRYLASAGAAPGNPWCASFVTWALRQSGHPLDGSGWAAVSHWVGAAEQHAHGLSLVSAHDARPGDVVAYDWGGGNDFSGDGHIGILASGVGADGVFSAVEGNAGDAVAHMQRHLDDARIVFIRVGEGAA